MSWVTWDPKSTISKRSAMGGYTDRYGGVQLASVWIIAGLPPRTPSRTDNSHGLDLDHEIGTGKAGDADSRAGRGCHTDIAHAHVSALLEFVEVSDECVGLDDVSPCRARGLEAPVQVLERLLQLGAHIALANAIAVDL